LPDGDEGMDAEILLFLGRVMKLAEM